MNKESRKPPVSIDSIARLIVSLTVVVVFLVIVLFMPLQNALAMTSLFSVVMRPIAKFYFNGKSEK